MLREALDVRDRVGAGAMSAHGAALAWGHLIRRIAALADCQRLAKHLTTELPALFGFLSDFEVHATNWRAEQALRAAIVNRKVSGGNRSFRGAEAQQIPAALSKPRACASSIHVMCSSISFEHLSPPRPPPSPRCNRLNPL